MHLNQLRKSKLLFGTNARRVQLRDSLDRAQHFYFTALPSLQSEDVKASAAAMHEAGVWRLPFPVCSFEVEGLTFRDSTQNTTLSLPTVTLVSNLEPLEGAMFSKVREGWGIVEFSEQSVAGQSFADLIEDCIVTLSTKGIRRERWAGDRKLSPGRHEPRGITYTRVLVREAAVSSGSTERDASGQRCRVRLHLRRGHTREQRHGSGLTQIKTVFIEPTLVGYSEEGAVMHEGYVIRT